MSRFDKTATAAETRERAVVFGPSGCLIGILTEPAGSPDMATPSDQPAIVFINTGIMHRIGNNRLNTIWARRLASAGRTVLRFDLSGIGDSERRQDNLSLVDATLADMRAALDWLAVHRGMRRVILIGSCMGADRAIVYAGTDPRVSGVVLIDPTTPPTLRFYLRRYGHALLDMESWQRFVRGRFIALKFLYRQWRGRAEANGGRRRPAEVFSPALRIFFADAYRAAVKANVQMFVIFTGGVAYRYNYRHQLTDAFPEVAFKDLLQIEYFDQMDHLMSFEADRVKLFDITSAWLSRIQASVIQNTPILAADPFISFAPEQNFTVYEF